jgi:hypothetical protein
MSTRQKAQAHPKITPRDPKDIDFIEKLQMALAEALDQNEIVTMLRFSCDIESLN